jgi:DNA-binding response OmpR family regulator
MVLVIDDDLDFSEYLRIILEAHGYRVRCEPDAGRGAAALRAQRPDLVILDAMMSYDFQGLGLIKEIRQDPALAGMPVILVSAVLRTAEHALLEELPANAIDAFLVKPIEPSLVLEHVEKLIAGRAPA